MRREFATERDRTAAARNGQHHCYSLFERALFDWSGRELAICGISDWQHKAKCDLVHIADDGWKHRREFGVLYRAKHRAEFADCNRNGYDGRRQRQRLDYSHHSGE